MSPDGDRGPTDEMPPRLKRTATRLLLSSFWRGGLLLLLTALSAAERPDERSGMATALASAFGPPLLLPHHRNNSQRPQGRAIDTQTYYNVNRISNKSCRVAGRSGRCMFVWECIKEEGKHMGMCMDGFMFGSCCANKEPQPHSHKEGLALSHEGLSPQGLPQNDPQKDLVYKPSLSLSPELSATSTVVNTYRPSGPPSPHSSSSTHIVISKVPSSSLTPEPPTTKAPIVAGVSIGEASMHQTGRFPTEPLLSGSSAETGSSNSSQPVLEEGERSTESYWMRPSPPIVIKPPVPPSRPTRPPKPTKPLKDQWWYYPTKPSKNTTPFPKTTRHTTPMSTTSTTTSTTTPSTSTTPTTTTSSTTSTTTTTTTTTTSTTTTTAAPTTSTWATTTMAEVVTSSPSEANESTVATMASGAEGGPVASSNHTENGCGVAKMMPMPEGRIVNGSTSAFGKWPWQVSVRRISFFGFSSTHRCGGALLNSRWVATAGHCVDDLLVAQIRIRVGEYDFSSVLEPHPYIERSVIRKVVHPKYDFFTYEHDLALVKVEEKINFTPHVSPICLPGNDDLLIGEMATVTGWGRLSEHGTLPSVLQEASVPIMSNENCRNLFLRGGRKESIPDIFLCAGYEDGGRDSCQGDSGGPLQVKGRDGRYFLAGIISWGIGCAEANLPGVCTRISKFVPFILQTVS